ncbi:hypothetical protein AURDEDRAFT_173620 [Auricularia subglabra TFB-10046 SS5]|uniref:FAD/NAD(P)-binding domain-containing protein n=1 Tax=Auricularia subglabra (strain TFB-10046 / SS5) TaxID=717982 RepID=J0LHD3_AURST|nr:hypothetical protein AURDEDRAFT_173620 [Auricularia subglabra TFB-10046 SS5]
MDTRALAVALSGLLLVYLSTLVSGLFAARVCADHFDKVVVVEPEAWTFGQEAREPANFDTRHFQGNSATYNTFTHRRSRVYQYTAVHIYQVLLLWFLRRLFPGFDEHAKQWGMLIRPCDVNASLSGHFLRAPKVVNGKAHATIWTPRWQLEPLVRRLVCEGRPDIEFVQGTAAGFYLTSNRAIASVTVRLEDGQTKKIESALVIDCTGVTQSGLKLLSRAIPTLPPNLRESYNADIVYSTLEYPIPPYIRTIIFDLNPEIDCRMVSLLRCGVDRVVFTMGGWAVEMPVTMDDIRSFAKAVKVQHHIPDYFYKAVDLLRPVEHDLGTVYEARITNCYNTFYERAAHVLPRNFVAMGDATMRVNPRFGESPSARLARSLSMPSFVKRPPQTNHLAKEVLQDDELSNSESLERHAIRGLRGGHHNASPGGDAEVRMSAFWRKELIIGHEQVAQECARRIFEGTERVERSAYAR